MTIAQTLRRIAKLKGEYKESLERAAGSVTHEEKQPPAFSFGTCLEEADGKRQELIRLEAALRIANAQTKVDYEGRSITLAEATVWLQEFKGRIAWLRGLAVRPQEVTADRTNEYITVDGGNKYAAVERLFRCHLPEARRAQSVAEVQKKFDDLNDLVESANHRTSVGL
jgi:hypothetical protein